MIQPGSRFQTGSAEFLIARAIRSQRRMTIAIFQVVSSLNPLTCGPAICARAASPISRPRPGSPPPPCRPRWSRANRFRLKCFDQSLAFVCSLRAEFGLFQATIPLGQKVSGLLIVLVTCSAPPPRLNGRRCRLLASWTLMLLSPSLASLICCCFAAGNGVGCIQNLIAAFAVDGPLAVLGDP